MLRITRLAETADLVTLLVEGQIRSPWAAELEREFLTCRRACQRVVIDLAGVTFVSTEGVKVVKRLLAGGAELTRLSPIVEDLLK